MDAALFFAAVVKGLEVAMLKEAADHLEDIVPGHDQGVMIGYHAEVLRTLQPGFFNANFAVIVARQQRAVSRVCSDAPGENANLNGVRRSGQVAGSLGQERLEWVPASVMNFPSDLLTDFLARSVDKCRSSFVGRIVQPDVGTVSDQIFGGVFSGHLWRPFVLKRRFLDRSTGCIHSQLRLETNF